MEKENSKKLPLRPNVCMLLRNRDGLLFLGERLGEPGVWQFPQGGVEPDASLEENVLRELEEETGVKRDKLRIVKKLKAVNEYEFTEPLQYSAGQYRGQAQTYWLVDFTGKDSDININAFDPEFLSWRWCTVEEVRLLAEPKRLAGYKKALDELSNGN